jgi:hypothetical protein
LAPPAPLFFSCQRAASSVFARVFIGFCNLPLFVPLSERPLTTYRI